jgi:aspartate/methionine/tyrosine aminotransferase
MRAPMNPLFANLPTSIFEHMSGLAARSRGAINLGQGFPDFGWPEDVLDKAAMRCATARTNMRRCAALPELREAVAAFYVPSPGIAVSGRASHRHVGRDRGRSPPA